MFLNTKGFSWNATVPLTALMLLACDANITSMPAWAQGAQITRHPERGGIGLETFRQGFGRSIAMNRTARTISAFDARKSIFVTDVAIMAQLSFADVMQQLASQGGTTPAVTKEKLFEQWWDSAAKKPGSVPTAPHCDDEAPSDPATNLSKRNGFPFRCPRPEAGQPNPFVAPTGADGYTAIAYSNRFDLASTDGSDCGEYRVVFARNSGKNNPINRNLIIFEALIPNPAPTANPTPQTAHDGCRPIVEFWLSLSNPGQTSAQRGIKLRQFFLTGLPGSNVGPIIHVDNYSGNRGQIRTNQFMKQPIAGAGFEWSLREFKMEKNASGLRIVPATVKTNPGNDLFFAGSTDPRLAAFITTVTGNLNDLRGQGKESDLSAFKFTNPDQFNSFESNENEGQAHLGDPMNRFTAQPGGNLRAALTQALTQAGSQLTPDNIVRRIRTQTCAGCHLFSNNDAGLGTSKPWPASMVFVHQSEEDNAREAGPEGPRFGISPALKNEFIPFRQNIMLDYLSKFEAPSPPSQLKSQKK